METTPGASYNHALLLSEKMKLQKNIRTTKLQLFLSLVATLLLACMAIAILTMELSPIAVFGVLAAYMYVKFKYWVWFYDEKYILRLKRVELSYIEQQLTSNEPTG
jgi:hypothetical protein